MLPKPSMQCLSPPTAAAVPCQSAYARTTSLTSRPPSPSFATGTISQHRETDPRAEASHARRCLDFVLFSYSSGPVRSRRLQGEGERVRIAQKQPQAAAAAQRGIERTIVSLPSVGFPSLEHARRRNRSHSSIWSMFGVHEASCWVGPELLCPVCASAILVPLQRTRNPSSRFRSLSKEYLVPVCFR